MLQCLIDGVCEVSLSSALPVRRTVSRGRVTHSTFSDFTIPATVQFSSVQSVHATVDHTIPARLARCGITRYSAHMVLAPCLGVAIAATVAIIKSKAVIIVQLLGKHGPLLHWGL